VVTTPALYFIFQLSEVLLLTLKKEENQYGGNLPAQNGIKELVLEKNCKKSVKLNKCQGEKIENNKKISES
jgi:hypothetical protein